MEVLGVKDDLAAIKATMDDGVHMNEDCCDILARHIIKKIEEQSVTSKRGPTQREGPASKRSRSSAGQDSQWNAGPGPSGRQGVWRGAGNGGRGGNGGAGGSRRFSSY